MLLPGASPSHFNTTSTFITYLTVLAQVKVNGGAELMDTRISHHIYHWDN